MMKSIVLLIMLSTVHLVVAQQRARWVVKPKYESVSAFSEGVAAVKQNGKWGYVNSNGKEILPAAYELAYPFSDGVGVLAAADNTLLAIVDNTGRLTPIREKLKTDSRFAIFSDGLLLVYNGRKWGYLNKEGRLAIECKYASAQPFSEGLAAVLLSEYWYYIDTNGETRVRPDDKRGIYWAMGFHEGRAAVLYKNGMGYIDRNGRELNYRFPQMTPPPDAASYKKESLTCREGELYFDAKSRITAFVNNRGGKTAFMLPDEQENQPNIRKAANSKFGVIAFDDAFVANISLLTDTVASVFGKPAALSYVLANVSPSEIENLEVKINGTSVPIPASIAPGEKVKLTHSLDMTDEKEIEVKELLFTLSEYGLPAGEYRKRIVLKNIPAIRIEIPDASVSVKKGQSTYPLNIRIVNLSPLSVNNVSVFVGDQKKIIDYLNDGESRDLVFNLPVKLQDVEVIVKPPQTPFIAKSKRISIKVQEEIQKTPVNDVGLSKQIEIGKTHKK
ncbi:MAG: WG repeat-containing protein [Tannerellaceae bacterium]|jgi:hypothetical protein|nr:WG repeat-containing protein [Tannerellaceae bacterium]